MPSELFLAESFARRLHEKRVRVRDDPKFEASAAEPLAEKRNSCCHSERSKESLCAECQEKERFLVAPLLGMTRFGGFSATCEGVPYYTRRWSPHSNAPPFRLLKRAATSYRKFCS
jgi:hypothetical protein